MSIMSYNGASIIAMTGDGCVAIASDLRFGVQNQTNACDMPKVFKVHDHLFVGLAGLATDMQTLCVHAAGCSPRRLRASAAPRTCTEWSPNKTHASPSPQASALQVPTQPLQAARGAQHEAQHVRALRVVPAVREAVRTTAERRLPCTSTLPPRLTRACISSFGPWFCEPVIAGLEPDGTPFVTGMDLLGALCVAPRGSCFLPASDSLPAQGAG